jgi:hypothetical protein
MTAALVPKTVHVVTGLPEGMPLHGLDASNADADLVSVALDDIRRIPAFDFDNENTGIRQDNDEVRISLPNEWLIINEAIITEFL